MTHEASFESAQSPATNLLAIAPPGCGKTELLAQRAVYLAGQMQSHQRILALTFSNRATRNLRERLLSTLGPQRFRRYVRVTNFHGHAAEIIRAHGGTISVDPSSPMPRRSTLKTAISAYTNGLPIGRAIERETAIKAALSEAKQGPYDDDQVHEALVLSGNVFAQEIEADRREKGILHFDDLLRHAQRLLGIEAVARLYQLRYGAVLVDEFQDLSPQQLEIALATSSASRTFVGDPLQGIYSWAGARPVEVERKLRDICGDPQQLAVSYRSSPAVLGVVNHIAAMLSGEPLRAARPDAWPQGGAAASAIFRTGLEEAQWIVDMSAKILASNPKATIGVISRAGWRRGPIDTAFASATHLARQRWDLAIEDSEIVQQLIATVDRLPRQADMKTVRKTVLENIEAADAEALERAQEALTEFEHLVAVAGTPLAAASQLRTVDSSGAIEPGVHLLNAHTGKGQQFDWVFAPGLEDFHIPGNRATTQEHLKEELQVVLVMVSRARHGFIATYANSLISKAGNPYSTTESRWWEDITLPCSLGAEDLAVHIESLPSV